MKKYELTSEAKAVNGHTLHRIRAIKDFALADGTEIKSGDLGGWVKSEDNLSQDGNARVCGNARVYGNARVCGNAWVCDYAWVYGNAQVYGNARVCDDAQVSEIYHILVVGPIGSRAEFTTFFRTKDLKIGVSCGCFQGDLDAFLRKVQKTHGDNNHAKAYRAAAEFARVAIDLSDSPAENTEN